MIRNISSFLLGATNEGLFTTPYSLLSEQVVNLRNLKF